MYLDADAMITSVRKAQNSDRKRACNTMAFNSTGIAADFFFKDPVGLPSLSSRLLHALPLQALSRWRFKSWI